jgi:FlaA1/EpsC-like NDP-sugar epimerase
MIHLLRNRNFYLVLAADMAIFALSLLLAYTVRYAFAIPASEWRSILLVLPWVLAVKAAVFVLTGVYRGMWRYTSILDAWRLARATMLATLLLFTSLTLVNSFEGYPRSVFLADLIFTLFFCGGVRGGIRLYYMERQRLQEELGGSEDDAPITRHTRLLIVGAGDAAAAIIREIQGNPQSAYAVVGCVDDDPAKNGRLLLGVMVRGPIARLTHLARRLQTDEILLAMPSVCGEKMRLVVEACKATGLPFKILPSLSSLVDGRATVSDVREVKYEDLLGRPAVRLDWAGIGHYLTGKTVAVTGAGGSIGSELCRQIVRFRPAALVLIEANEFNLYRIEKDLRIDSKFDALFPAMGRVQDRPLMQHFFALYRPQVVFHAAACKHVPMVEANPWEGIFNNVLGSQVVMDVAEEHGVERFVQVSTDKAVRPTNVMGACKRVAEIYLQTRCSQPTRFMAVRFGNVLGSSGSVIPLFQQQIRAGGPVTVTDPEMTRYFMTIPEACQLILQAGAMGEGGEIFILEMGTPVKIADMARDMIRLSGKVPGEDIQIAFTGLRPGEKMYEELITHGEGIVPTRHEKIMVLRRQAVGPAAAEQRQVAEQMLRLKQIAGTFDPEAIKQQLHQFVPEYTPFQRGGPNLSLEAPSASAPTPAPVAVPSVRVPQLT